MSPFTTEGSTGKRGGSRTTPAQAETQAFGLTASVLSGDVENASDAWIPGMSEDEVLEMLGPEDGAGWWVVAESMWLDKQDAGLDPETVVLQRVMAKWRQRRGS